mmetsp:Transcript_4190/g.11052  ORF Transcript_4190/g.11052 Transcript_4190/m.11052 type:complete len:504 (+) Transcript_4190:139-1650(+)
MRTCRPSASSLSATEKLLAKQPAASQPFISKQEKVVLIQAHTRRWLCARHQPMRHSPEITRATSLHEPRAGPRQALQFEPSTAALKAEPAGPFAVSDVLQEEIRRIPAPQAVVSATLFDVSQKQLASHLADADTIIAIPLSDVSLYPPLPSGRDPVVLMQLAVRRWLCSRAQRQRHASIERLGGQVQRKSWIKGLSPLSPRSKPAPAKTWQPIPKPLCSVSPARTREESSSSSIASSPPPSLMPFAEVKSPSLHTPSAHWASSARQTGTEGSPILVTTSSGSGDGQPQELSPAATADYAAQEQWLSIKAGFEAAVLLGLDEHELRAAQHSGRQSIAKAITSAVHSFDADHEGPRARPSPRASPRASPKAPASPASSTSSRSSARRVSFASPPTDASGLECGPGAIVMTQKPATLLGPVLPQPTPKPTPPMWMPMGIMLEPLDDRRVDSPRDIQLGIDFCEFGQHITKGIAGLTNLNLFCTRDRDDPHELARNAFLLPATPTKD